MTSDLGPLMFHLWVSYVPLAQIVTLPAPYWPLGISPSKSPYSSGWSSTWTARLLRRGSSGTPRGTAHETRTPSRSRRRSQCRRRAWCCWTTKRRTWEAASSVVASPAGSGVSWKSRLALYERSLPMGTKLRLSRRQRAAHSPTANEDLELGAGHRYLPPNGFRHRSPVD